MRLDNTTAYLVQRLQRRHTKTAETMLTRTLILALMTVAASFRPSSVPHGPRSRLDATVRDKKTGKIYVGEPEPLEEIGQVLGDLVDQMLGRRRAEPNPSLVPIPIPVEQRPDQRRER